MTEFHEAFDRVFKSGQFILGKEVEEFETAVLSYTGESHAIGISSGTDALIVSLMSLGIGQGNRVACPAFTFISTAEAIVRVGASPVFVDIDPDTFLMQEAPRNVDAIIPVHLFGQNRKQFPSEGAYLIEDSAQAFGSGPLQGCAACYSFYPTKNLAGMGDGGMVVTNNSTMAEDIRARRNHGTKNKIVHDRLGGNFRLDELQAALLKVKIKTIAADTAARIWKANAYNQLLEGVDVIRPTAIGNHVYNQYVIRTKNPDELKRHLEDYNIHTRAYYTIPLHLQPCFRYLNYQRGDFPNAEKAATEVLSLPMTPGTNVEYVVDRIKEVR